MLLCNVGVLTAAVSLEDTSWFRMGYTVVLAALLSLRAPWS
ncbi:hypothetical protein AB0M20_40985 [Actinoplanes sp. NPDC051633]